MCAEILHERTGVRGMAQRTRVNIQLAGVRDDMIRVAGVRTGDQRTATTKGRSAEIHDVHVNEVLGIGRGIPVLELHLNFGQAFGH